jgi:hypothetical protein
LVPSFPQFADGNRSGVIVTESFNYKADPEVFVGFVWRFSKATNERRGFECSAVTVDSEADKGRFVDAIERHVEEQLPGPNAGGIKEEEDRHFWPGALTRLTVGTGAEASDIRVSRPTFTSKDVTGESTRGHWGVDRKSREVVSVKGVWRTGVSGVETEGVIPKELTNILELICHGDVVHEGKTACFLFV